MLRIVAWLAVCLWMGASDELSFVEEEDLALEDEGQVISHDDVMRAAESVAREKYEHSFSFMDLENWDGSLAALVLQHRSAAAFVLYFHKPSCEHCERFSPILSDAVDRFGEASPGAEVLWVGINCDESGFEDLGELYEIVEFPTMMLIEDMYSEPFKYEGGWKSASEVVDYVAAFADVHDCAEATHEVVVSGARITLGGAMTSNQRALSWVEATRAVAKLGEATDATVTVACADSGKTSMYSAIVCFACVCWSMTSLSKAFWTGPRSTISSAARACCTSSCAWMKLYATSKTKAMRRKMTPSMDSRARWEGT